MQKPAKRIEGVEVDDEGNEGDATDDNDKKKLLPASHYIGEKYLWEMTEPSYPVQQAEGNVESVAVVPSTRIDIAHKIGQDQQPRFLEDEGIYIGKTPIVPKSKNQNKVEHRIIMENRNSKWFGTDGKLVALPNPIGKKATRPPHFEEDQGHGNKTFYCPPTLPGPDGLPAPVTTSGKMAASANIQQCQLEIDLSSIVFDHHHLFSLEHFLSTKLAATYSSYSRLRLNIVAKDLDKRLEVLYQSSDELKAKEWSVEEKEFQERRLETYRTEIKTIRTERDSDSQQERELVRTLLGYWKDVRELRNRQGYSTTNHKIAIKKESVNQTADKLRWEREIGRELQFKKEEHETNFQENMKSFRLAMDSWKETHHRRKEARKRQKQRQKDAEKGSGTADANEMADDEALLAEPEQTKPEMPAAWNEAKVRKELEDHALLCRRAPGEPKIYLELLTNHSGTNETQDNRELNRRNAVSKTKIFTRIFFNGKEVCQSSAKVLSQDFVVQLGQIFPIQILQLPESLTLQIIEGGTLKTTVLAEIKLPLCESTQTLSEVVLEPIEFKSDLKINHDHAGLGAGLNFPVTYDGSEISHDRVNGKVFARVGWARGADGTILSPPIDQWNPKNDSKLDPLKEVMDIDGKIDAIKLEEWISKARLDPNDPENEELIAR